MNHQVNHTLLALPTWTGPALAPWLKLESTTGGGAGWLVIVADGPPRRFLFSLLVLGGSNCPMGGIFEAGLGV